MEYGIGWKGSCSNGEYEVVELYLGKNNGNIYDRVRFAISGKTGIFARANIKKGGIRDKYAITVHGIGALGEHQTYAGVANPIYNAWKSMLLRCKNSPQKVDSYWLCFSNFEKDFYKIPFAKNYVESINNGELKKWALDKDCMGKGMYSLDSVIYLPYELNKVINKGPTILLEMGATLPSREQIINYIETNFEEMIR